jgi:hypothetical protein
VAAAAADNEKTSTTSSGEWEKVAAEPNETEADASDAAAAVEKVVEPDSQEDFDLYEERKKSFKFAGGVEHIEEFGTASCEDKMIAAKRRNLMWTSLWALIPAVQAVVGGPPTFYEYGALYATTVFFSVCCW